MACLVGVAGGGVAPAEAQYGTPTIVVEPDAPTPRAASPNRLKAGRAAERRPRSLIPERTDRDVRAVARPSSDADRAWRRTRAAPRLGSAAPSIVTRPALREPPRIGAGGRRLNVPGRPDTRDAIGEARRRYPRADPLARPAGGVVRTDAGTRINQLAPR